jgi:DNA-binding SARP family transcriptional activator/tetratricopeptide (TPR) repeat protein
VLSIGVLGPLEVALDGRPVRLTSSRLRTLLVVLAMAAGSPLSVDRLATALWDGDLPEHVRRVVQTYLGRLRSTLGTGAIVTEPTGYRLRIDPAQVDALRFTQLLEVAAQAPDPTSERARLTEALALWRGSPFDGVESDWLARAETPRLIERYLVAVERRVDLDLAAGRHGELIAHLQELTARYPLRESLWVRLLVALDGSGRQAEALAQYDTIRRRLAEELGTDPGQQLRRVHADLLAARPSRITPATVPGGGPPVVPRQLPGDIDGFTGRTDALATLDALANAHTGHTPTAVVISAIAGTAGVGKTALAVHWAHRIADEYPDGQLYVNLRGFHPSGQAMTPAEAIRGFLTALDVPGHRIPSNLDAQAGLYRSLLAGKRMLVVLDNARDAEQVRPLLPGSPTTLVIVTSRNQLTSLIATEGARPLVLDLLPRNEARRLLARRLHPERITAEPAATEEIITHCAQLPLALAIAAAHAATRPSFPLAALAAQLRDERSRLDVLASGDPATDARAVFSWSYHTLSPAAARLFRLLGLHPGPDIAAPAAASLAAVPPGQARRLLAELTNAHLLTEPNPGRYTLHDLLRTYATELTHTHDTEQHAAQHRLLDHYLHTAHRAARLVYPHRDDIPVAPPGTGASIGQLSDRDQALAWFAAERAVLVEMVGHGFAAGFDVHAWQLSWTLANFLHRHGTLDELIAVQRIALAAARRCADRAGQAHALRILAAALIDREEFDHAHTHLRQALELSETLDDQTSQAHVRSAIGRVHQLQGRLPEAIQHTESALVHYRAVGHLRGEANALNELGWYHAEAGSYEVAADLCHQAIGIQQKIGDQHGEADTWDSLGYIHHLLGMYREAAGYYRTAMQRYGELNVPGKQAETLVRLGDTALAAGDRDEARAVWRRALVVFEQLEHPDAKQVRGKLDALAR